VGGCQAVEFIRALRVQLLEMTTTADFCHAAGVAIALNVGGSFDKSFAQ
jgi:hypothetical protein